MSRAGLMIIEMMVLELFMRALVQMAIMMTMTTMMTMIMTMTMMMKR